PGRARGAAPAPLGAGGGGARGGASSPRAALRAGGGSRLAARRAAGGEPPAGGAARALAGPAHPRERRDRGPGATAFGSRRVARLVRGMRIGRADGRRAGGAVG